jgi:hypothetical protein
LTKIQIGRVYYPISNRDGCRDFTNSDFPDDFFNTDELAPIVLVDRGVCSFVAKVRNIEKLGVKLALVADNKEEVSENVIMTDDGSGHSINIPSFILRKKEADAIKKTLESKKKEDQKVYIKAQFEMAHPDNRVEYELWYSSILDVDAETLNQIGTFQSVLSDNALFTPRVLTYACPHCSAEIRSDSCIGDGAYCAIFPSFKLPLELRDIKGKQLLEESLRERCLYDTLVDDYQQNANFSQWF